MSVRTLILELHEKFANSVQQSQGHWPLIQHDEQWPSPCETGEPRGDGLIAWQAVPRTPGGDLNALASALDTQFSAELNDFYGSAYGGNILLMLEGEEIELLQAWNEEDFERLQQNITGHVLMKRRLKQADTVFIGLAAQEDVLITVQLSSGEVCLERVGKAPHTVLAPSLSAFLSQLSAQF
ncbi:SecY-interacting protein [Pseudoalteromonas sp. DL2-H2.2]|uniref:SecY-interacting protein n=1 Tax=Pseudoalteromonas sp. DL2-H2.2 TaxID=2908889 RepID=UPI001F394D62|nr:SecY-interacting protein [Pseudoalteromonas sp. DL2-H2.2]MCF2908639.1 SecY-interacting protein [Pseudoalteromonas sp. DL2-H2.2]